jgi:hypothetical protein
MMSVLPNMQKYLLQSRENANYLLRLTEKKEEKENFS